MKYTAVKVEEEGDTYPLVTLDSVLESLSGGMFHWILLILCGLSFMADAMVYYIAVYVLYEYSV